MDLGIAGRLALVTGSTQGIGRAIAEALVAEGARVIVNGRRDAAVRDTVAALSRSGEAHGIAADMATAEGAQVRPRRRGEDRCGRYTREQRRLLRGQEVRGHPGPGMDGYFRVERDERRAPRPRAVSRHAGAESRPHRIHRERAERQAESGHDSLRHDEDRPGLDRARTGRSHEGNGGDGQQRARRADVVGGRRRPSSPRPRPRRARRSPRCAPPISTGPAFRRCFSDGRRRRRSRLRWSSCARSAPPPSTGRRSGWMGASYVRSSNEERRDGDK